MTTTERAVAKAQAVLEGWRARYPGAPDPSKAAVLLVLAVAEHETRCGDAWPGEHNWGAIQRRALNAAERAVVKDGGKPEPPDANAALHGDSSPISGKYQCWFWAFPTDAEGAGKLLGVLLDQRPAIKSRIDTLTPDALAELMYRSRYYEGFHDPRPKAGESVAPGALTAGQRANVADYARALRGTHAAFARALERWTPGAGLESPPWPPGELDLLDVATLQRALAALGYAPGPADGVRGARTRAAVRAFQAATGLKPDGVDGPKTRAALAGALEGSTAPGGA